MKANTQKGISLCGRYFTPKELGLIQEIVSLYPRISRKELSSTISENLSWRQTNGKPKQLTCLNALEKLEALGYLKLPELRSTKKVGPNKPIVFSPQTNPGSLVYGRVDQMGPVIVEPVMNKAEERLWNEYMARYHYLGYKVSFGSQQKYFILSGDGFKDRLGCLFFSASAWALSCRDEWIGWSRSQKSRNLYLIINNSRFLVFPWIRVTNLASKALKLIARRISEDWQLRYKYRPVLLESFVDRSKFRGTCYRAANWIYLGQSRGRGRMDRYGQYLSSPKDTYLFPLLPNFREQLRTEVDNG